MAAQAPTTSGQDQHQLQDQATLTTTSPRTTPSTDTQTLQDQLAQKDTRIKALETQLRTQTSLGELYFAWGEENDALLRKLTKVLKAEGREVRRLRAEVVKGRVDRAKMRAVAEVLVRLYREETVEGKGGGGEGQEEGETAQEGG